MTSKLLYFMSMFALYVCFKIKRPNIVFIVGDDIGWGDVSLHGSNQIMTPNIDMIGLEGIVIKNYYTDAYGTPSRSAMFTGKYPLRMGTQGVSIGAAEDRGLPITEKLLPSYLQELGYATHLVGKWQLGKSREYFLPTYRGFETFYGFLGSSIDYVTYNHVESCNGTQFFGLDFFNNSDPVLHKSGHLTEILTKQSIKIIKEHDTSVPLYLHVAHAAAHIGGGLVNLQAPDGLVAANDHIAHSARRFCAGLVDSVDRSIGEIISALAESDMLNNTLIVFVSDNGAASAGQNSNFGSNLPLRGTKGTPWEGSVRSTAVLWHYNLIPRIWKGIFHVTDWMPTLLSAAGGNTLDKIDGIDQWNAMIYNKEEPRNETVIAIDDLNEWGALRDRDYKIVIGNVDQCSSYYYGKELSKNRFSEPLYEKSLLDSETAIVFREVLNINSSLSNLVEKRESCSLDDLKSKVNKTQLCVPTKVKGCLFNLTADPGETTDLWNERPEIVQQLTLRFRLLWSEINPRRPPSFDVRADPSRYNYIWYPWLDSGEPSPEPVMMTPRYPQKVSTDEFQYYVNLNLKSMRDKLNTYVKSITDTFVNKVQSLYGGM